MQQCAGRGNQDRDADDALWRKGKRECREARRDGSGKQFAGRERVFCRPPREQRAQHDDSLGTQTGAERQPEHGEDEGGRPLRPAATSNSRTQPWQQDSTQHEPRGESRDQCGDVHPQDRRRDRRPVGQERVVPVEWSFGDAVPAVVVGEITERRRRAPHVQDVPVVGAACAEEQPDHQHGGDRQVGGAGTQEAQPSGAASGSVPHVVAHPVEQEECDQRDDHREHCQNHEDELERRRRALVAIVDADVDAHPRISGCPCLVGRQVAEHAVDLRALVGLEGCGSTEADDLRAGTVRRRPDVQFATAPQIGSRRRRRDGVAEGRGHGVARGHVEGGGLGVLRGDCHRRHDERRLARGCVGEHAARDADVQRLRGLRDQRRGDRRRRRRELLTLRPGERCVGAVYGQEPDQQTQHSAEEAGDRGDQPDGATRADRRLLGRWRSIGLGWRGCRRHGH